MKKVKVLFAVLVISLTTIFQSNKSLAQTLEHTYNVQLGNDFSYTDLGNNNYKYFIIDYVNNKFSLYNLDHTPYMLNITPGVSIAGGAFTIGYITSTLFDCDSANIEYVITTVGSANKPFYIYRTDGTLLFQKDSVVVAWCYGCYGGVAAPGIFNTPMGTKLILANQNSNERFVYALCGTLTESINRHLAKLTLFKIVNSGNQIHS